MGSSPKVLFYGNFSIYKKFITLHNTQARLYSKNCMTNHRETSYKAWCISYSKHGKHCGCHSAINPSILFDVRFIYDLYHVSYQFWCWYLFSVWVIAVGIKYLFHIHELLLWQPRCMSCFDYVCIANALHCICAKLRDLRKAFIRSPHDRFSRFSPVE